MVNNLMLDWQINASFSLEITCKAYLALSFLFDSSGNGMPLIRVATLYGSFLFLALLYYINVLSHEVNENLSELKNSISLSPLICFEDKFQLVERMNLFNGFDANGYFTLGKQLLTSIVSNFTTFIIVLIQFKMAEKNWSAKVSLKCFFKKMFRFPLVTW